MTRLATLLLFLAQSPVADNDADEPIAKTFSLVRAKDFMHAAAGEWTRERKCFSCHTNLSYLYTQPGQERQKDVRTALEAQVDRWPDKKPRDFEVVVAAAALAYNDAKTTKTLSPATKKALDRMWSLQRDDGGWKWYLCGWPPMESDDHYGVTLAALAAGVAPGDYAKSDAAAAGIQKIQAFLQKNTPKNAHHKAMMIWAGTHLPGIVPESDRAVWLNDLRGLQHKDGGWSAADLIPWTRDDEKEQTPEISDGYGTGFTTFILRTAGAAKNDPAVTRGVAWLKSNQRDSGRWFTRSLFRDSKHYLTHAGTAFSIMASESCE